jgi:hypothetical protein
MSAFPSRRLPPVRGITDVRLYANVSSISEAPLKPVAIERKTAAAAHRDAETQLKRKVDQADRVLSTLETRVDTLDARIKELQKRKAAALARAERIEDAILTELDARGVNALTGIRVKLRAQPAPAALEVLHVELVPAEFLRAPKAPAPTVDKVALKAALAADEDLLPSAFGCRLTQRTILVRS